MPMTDIVGRHTSVAITALRDASDDLVGFAKVTRDLTERRSAERSRSRATDQVVRLHTVATALGGAVSLVEVAAVIISAGLQAVGADAGIVARAVEHGRELEIVGEMGLAPDHIEEWAAWIAAAGFAAEVVGGRQRCPIAAPIPLADVARSRSAVWLRDPAEIRAFYPALAELFARSGYRALVCLPLISRGETSGALRLSFTTDRTFDSDERVFLTSFAHQCALALDRAQLYADALAARDLAERGVKKRDELLSIVAHDLGNPVNAVGLWARIIHDAAPRGAEGETARSGAGTIQALANRMTMLLHDLRDATSIDAGHLGIQIRERDLVAIVSETVDSLTPLCIEKELSLSGSARALRVACDANRVQQVLGNLVANAIKFTPRGGKITIDALPSGREVRFCVADTGPGIPEERRAQVFERYWRGKESSSTTGVGLGLFISKGIVAAHGGTIWMESAVGGGSAFCFTIPSA